MKEEVECESVKLVSYSKGNTQAHKQHNHNNQSSPLVIEQRSLRTFHWNKCLPVSRTCPIKNSYDMATIAMSTELELLDMQTQVTKATLKHKLRTLSHRQQDAILSALGGLECIVSTLLTSDANLDSKQLHSLDAILSDQEHQAHKVQKSISAEQKLEYTFNDEDIILYSLFSAATAQKIIDTLNSKRSLVSLFLLFASAWILRAYAVMDSAWPMLYAYWSCAYVVVFVYCVFWTLNSNKQALKLLMSHSTWWLTQQTST